MDYDHIELSQIEPYEAPLGENGRTLLALARSVLLSSDDRTKPLSTDEIAATIASKNRSLAAGQGQRWEKTLKDTLRNRYCFISHSIKGHRSLYYTCDPKVDPKLVRQQNIKRRLDSSTPSSTRSPSVQPVLPSGPSTSDEQTASLAAVIPPENAEDITASKELCLETSALYEWRDRRRRVYYCQRCGPHVVMRRRTDGSFPVRPLRRLFRLYTGGLVNGKTFTNLIGCGSGVELPRTISLTIATALLEEAGLVDSLQILLDPDLPSSEDTEPVSRVRPSSHRSCPYCRESFVGKALRKHFIERRGTCQMKDPIKLRQYLSGQARISDDSDASSEDEDGLQSFSRPLVPPFTTTWTEEEVDRLFYAIPRYSRFRVDAIAEHIRTKTVVEVDMLLQQLAEQSKLLKHSGSTAKKRRHPVAREMSQKWVNLEEEVAEDIVIWDAFNEQAQRTPFEWRDGIQRSAVRHKQRSDCLICQDSACDGSWPVCRPCKSRDLECIWPLDLGHQDGQIRNRVIKDAFLKAYPDYVPHGSKFEAIQKEFMTSMTWHHLVALALKTEIPLRDRLEMLWWQHLSKSVEKLRKGKSKPDRNDGSNAVAWSSYSLRSATAKLLTEARLAQLSPVDMEALFQYLKQASKADGFALPVATEIRDLLSSQTLEGQRERLRAAFVSESDPATQEQKVVSQRKVKCAMDWQEIPLSRIRDGSNMSKQTHLDGVYEEIHQARHQLKAVAIDAEKLGSAAQLFNLRKLGIMMDFYRRDTDVDNSAIAKDALDMLYTEVRAYVRRVLILSLSLAASRGLDPSFHLRKCVMEAIKQLKEAQPVPNNNRKIPTTCNEVILSSMEIVEDPPPPSTSTASTTRVGTPTITKSTPASPAPPASKSTSQRQPIGLFDPGPFIMPRNYDWDPDLIMSTSEGGVLSEEDQDDELGMGMGSSEDEEEKEQYLKEMAAERALAEQDKLDDAIYEARLWQLFDEESPNFNAENASTNADAAMRAGIEGATLEDMDDVQLLEDFGILSDDSSEDDEEEDEEGQGLDDKDSSDSSTSTSGEEDHNEHNNVLPNATDQREHDSERPSKRLRYDVGNLTMLPAAPAMTGRAASIFIGRGIRPKVKSKEFISTSDEEDL